MLIQGKNLNRIYIDESEIVSAEEVPLGVYILYRLQKDYKLYKLNPDQMNDFWKSLECYTKLEPFIFVDE